MDNLNENTPPKSNSLKTKDDTTIEESPSNENNLIKEQEEASFGNEFLLCPQIEFDAPRYINFSSVKFLETRRLLNKIVLNQDTAEQEEENDSSVNDDDEEDVDMEDVNVEFGQFFPVNDSSDADMDEWFSRFHPLHEPLRPQTPPGPLISPERFAYSNRFPSLKASPLKFNSSSSIPSSSPLKTKSPQVVNKMFASGSPRHLDINTPSKGPNTRIGLRAKPARVLKPNNTISSSSFASTAAVTTTSSSLNSSPIRTSSSFRFSQHQISLSSPVPSRPDSSADPSTPTKRFSNVSNSSLTGSLGVSSLTKSSFLVNSNSETPHVRFNHLITSPSRSPLKMKFSGGTASPLSKAVGILQLQEDEANDVDSSSSSSFDLTRKKRSSPSESQNPTESLQKSLDKRPKSQPNQHTNVEDIKKLLSQHNSRLRPNLNKTTKK